VFISHVDTALERLVRERLPLSEDIGEVSFDTPDKDWAAKQTRITVNLFLYDVQRSSEPSRSAMAPSSDRPGMFRRPQPMVQLSYLVSTWAGGPRDEHQLLGDVVSLIAGSEVLPPDLAPAGLSSTMRLRIGDERHAGRELWQSIGGPLRPAVQLQVSVAADTYDWEPQAPQVKRIVAMADRMRTDG
jgi:hypothetical protein